LSQRRLRLTLGYRGTRYAGWAVQSPTCTRGRPTVQATLETALGRALGHTVRVTAAGRTDAGVHADAQVVSFETASPMTAAGLQQVLPRWLPDDLWILDVAEASPGFDARRSVLRRWYRYAVWRGSVPTTSWQGRCLVLDEHNALDLGAMRRGATALLGRRDFASLATKRPPRQSTERTVFAADWLQISRSLIIFEVCADAFLKQMVRTIVGSLLWVGSGRWSVERFVAAIASADRRAAGPNAPAVGLSLHRIEY
jgi:tRNA pseudouridine38-40 synthase